MSCWLLACMATVLSLMLSIPSCADPTGVVNYGRNARATGVTTRQGRTPGTRADAPFIQSVNPGECAPGETVAVNGSNFGARASENMVQIDGISVAVASASPRRIQIVVPAGLKSGMHNLTVMVAGTPSNQVQVSIKSYPPPTLESLSLQSAPPGTILTISGRNFARNLADNQVTIGGVDSQVNSVSGGSLTVTIPDISSPQFNVPVTVTAGGVKATNSLYIDIQSRIY